MMEADWTLALIAVAAYCIYQTARDLRDRRYGWAAAGIIAAVLAAAVPIEAHYGPREIWLEVVPQE